MYPLIKSGAEIVYTDNFKFEKLSEGDIVIYNNGEELVCHQLTELYKEGWKAKGVNNRFQDRGFVTKSNFVGKVQYFKNKSKT